MKRTAATILISGAGQLGSRYLQGLVNCQLPLNIHVQDTDRQSLMRAADRWNAASLPGSPHAVTFHTELTSLPRQMDVVIVATMADVRPHVVGDLASHFSVRFWILEKVLAQRESALDDLVSSTRAASGAWVNTPRRMTPWYREIESQLGCQTPLTLKVGGGAWGLACNAVHFLDLLAWWSGETLLDVRCDHLEPRWFESKRPGAWEVRGTLEAGFSGGSCASLSAGDGDAPLFVAVSDRHRSWRINEAEGLATCSDGTEIPGRIPYQSEMSAALVTSILEHGHCDLPTLESSVALHRPFIRAMLEHWMRAGHPGANFVPIT